MDKTYFGSEEAAVKKCPFKIFVDQAGYYPDSKKTAVMNFPCESFRIIDSSGVCRYEGKTEYFGYDENSGDTVYRADFSNFTGNGTYRVISGNEMSAEFRIAENVYDKVFVDILKAFYYLRCGCGLEEKYAGVYKHGKCHNSPALLYDDKKRKRTCPAAGMMQGITEDMLLWELVRRRICFMLTRYFRRLLKNSGLTFPKAVRPIFWRNAATSWNGS